MNQIQKFIEAFMIKRFKKRVIKCFDNVDWSTQSFTYGIHKMESKSGETKFYGVKTIDDAIKKLNKLV